MIDLPTNQLIHNSYYNDNPLLFNELLMLVNNFPKSFGHMLNHSKKYIRNWIDQILPAVMSDDIYTMATKCYWVIYGLKAFPTCSVCHSSCNYIGKNVKIFNGYSPYCSIRCAQHSLITKELTKQTNRKKYGTDYFTQTSEYLVKTKITNNRKYGKDWACQDRTVIANIENAIFEKFGVRHALQSKECFRKYEETCLIEYGVKNAGGAPDIQKKIHIRYTYDNRNFDSKPEIAYYVWLTDNGIKFEYQPDDSIQYEFDGKERLYFPDFKVYDSDGRFHYVEMKGDHFLAEDGTWRNPFRDSAWSDEDYARECARYEAKRQCCIANGAVIMYSADYQKYLDYVSAKYGPEWLDGFKKK